MKIKKLAILAGAGKLPEIAADNALQMHIPTKIYALGGIHHLNPRFNSLAEEVAITQFGRLLKKLKQDEVSHIVMLGKVSKEYLFKNLKFDLKTVTLLALMINRNDDNIFKTMEREFNKINVSVVPQSYFLQSLLMAPGTYSKKKPSANDRKDIEYGFFYAQKLGEIDVGQTVVVKNQTVLALEAIEGTDECIRRGGRFAHGKGAVVCKAEKKYQDQRWDIPTVGIETLRTMAESGCHLLAIEAHKTFVVNTVEFIQEVNRLNLIFVVEKFRN